MGFGEGEEEGRRERGGEAEMEEVVMTDV